MVSADVSYLGAFNGFADLAGVDKAKEELVEIVVSADACPDVLGFSQS